MNNQQVTASTRCFRWTPLFLIFLGGGLCSGAFAPFYVWPLFCFGVTAFLLFLDKATSLKQAFWIGWWWGWGFFTTSLYWISFSLGVELQKFFWLLPFSIVGLPAFLALFMGFLAVLVVLGSDKGVVRWIVFAAIWSVMEWLRGHILTGFPWNLAAYMWAEAPFLRQAVSGIGPYGLGFLTLLWLSTPYLFVRENALTPERKAASIFLLFSLSITWLSGKISIEAFPLQDVPHLWMRVVQPNVPQKEKWKASRRYEQLQDLVHLSLQPSSKPLTHIIWPEAAIPFFLDPKKGLEGMLPLVSSQGALLVGAPRRSEASSEKVEVWNSLWILTPSGAISSIYDKNHLVPFGEYVPLHSFLDLLINPSWTQKITAGEIDFSAGLGPQTLNVPGAPPVSPLICYEAIFPTQVAVHTQPRPEWLLNLTNDAWFGDSTGPYQHLDSARFRAIEEGLPLVRAANTGVSAIIDAHGTILQYLPLNQKGVLDFVLPQALSPTLYSQWGDVFFWINLLGFLMVVGAFVYRETIADRVLNRHTLSHRHHK